MWGNLEMVNYFLSQLILRMVSVSSIRALAAFSASTIQGCPSALGLVSPVATLQG